MLLDPEIGIYLSFYPFTLLFIQSSKPNVYDPAGQDATEAFFSLHRYEILEKPQYQRLQIGIIDGEKSVIHGRIAGELSKVPYAEPTWLSPGYYSPYYSEVTKRLFDCPLELNELNSSLSFKGHRKFQLAVRHFFDAVVYDDSMVRFF